MLRNFVAASLTMALVAHFGHARKGIRPFENCTARSADVPGRAVCCCNGHCLDGTTIWQEHGMGGTWNDACLDASVPGFSATQIFKPRRENKEETGDGACWFACQWERSRYSWYTCDCPEGFYGSFAGECDHGYQVCLGCTNPTELFVGSVSEGFECLDESCMTPDGNSCEFYSDCLAKLSDCGSDGYALDFGQRYCELYLEGGVNFSPDGVEWSAKVRLCLQEAMVPMIQATTTDRPTCQQIRTAAFDSHPQCYVDSGFCSLPVRDWGRLLGSLDAKAIFSKETYGQMWATLVSCHAEPLFDYFSSNVPGAIFTLSFEEISQDLSQSLPSPFEQEQEEQELPTLLFCFLIDVLWPVFPNMIIVPITVYQAPTGRNSDLVEIQKGVTVFQFLIFADNPGVARESASQVFEFFQADPKPHQFGSLNLTFYSGSSNLTQPLLLTELPSQPPSSQPPSHQPSLSTPPSEHPSHQHPSRQPSHSISPSDQPSREPSHSVSPSDQQSHLPSSQRPSQQHSHSISPSRQPSPMPSSQSPSHKPSLSNSPSEHPSQLPSSHQPSHQPSHSILPSEKPSQQPSPQASHKPSLSISPSEQPSRFPSSQPSSLKPVHSIAPSEQPSQLASYQPSQSISPSEYPSPHPSPLASHIPSLSISPSEQPSQIPSSPPPLYQPSRSILPSEPPSRKPSSRPLSNQPSRFIPLPSEQPSQLPSLQQPPPQQPSQPNKPPIISFQAPKSPPTTTGTPGPGGLPGCFSSQNAVLVEGVGKVMIADIKVGDMVMGRDGFSKVYSLAHYDKTREATFLQIFVEHQDKPLEITSNHMVFVTNKNGKKTTISAGKVRVGDQLEDKIVVNVHRVTRIGLFAPLTDSGAIIVSGVTASCYVSFINDGLPQHVLSHMALAPVRLACCWFVGSNTCAEETHTNGISTWFHPFVAPMTIIGKMPVLVQIGALAAALPGLALLYAAEQIIWFFSSAYDGLLRNYAKTDTVKPTKSVTKKAHTSNNPNHNTPVDQTDN